MVAWEENGQGYWTFEEVKNHPVVAKMVKRFVSVQQDDIAKAFYRVWTKHYNVWESPERRDQHSLDNISKILWDNNEKCFKVYYKKTKKFSSTWYHYTLSGEWY